MRPSEQDIKAQNHANPTFDKVLCEIYTASHRIVADKRIHYVIGLSEF